MKKIFLGLSFILFGLFVYIASVFYRLPDVRTAKSCIYTKTNNVFLCPTEDSYVKLSQVSDSLIQSVLVSEDVGFFNHNGFDFFELKQSFLKNIRHRRFARGGSTISQQLVKNLFLTPTKTLQRKLNEAILTVRLEKEFSKNQILEKYLNVIQFGKRLFGIKQASLFYFQKMPDQLSLTEAAFLAHLLPSPVKYSRAFLKGELTEFDKDQMADIIDKLLFFKRISEAQHTEAMAELDTYGIYR